MVAASQLFFDASAVVKACPIHYMSTTLFSDAETAASIHTIQFDSTESPSDMPSMHHKAFMQCKFRGISRAVSRCCIQHGAQLMCIADLFQLISGNILYSSMQASHW